MQYTTHEAAHSEQAISKQAPTAVVALRCQYWWTVTHKGCSLKVPANDTDAA